MVPLQKSKTVSANLVPAHKRQLMLPRYAGPYMLQMESSIYDLMSTLCRTYSFGYWHMYELSNGGFYMAPSDRSRTYDLYWQGNMFSDTLSGDAAGIVACLFAYSAMLEKTRDQRFDKLYWALRDFAHCHPESCLIYRAID